MQPCHESIRNVTLVGRQWEVQTSSCGSELPAKLKEVSLDAGKVEQQLNHCLFCREDVWDTHWKLHREKLPGSAQTAAPA